VAFPPAASPDTASTAPPVKNVLQPQPLVLNDSQLARLINDVHLQLQTAVTNNAAREKFLAKLLRAYKALPEYEVKNFPWPGASNVVIPIVAITVDTISSRLQRAVFGAKDPVEAHINTKTSFMMTVPPDPNFQPPATPPSDPTAMAALMQQMQPHQEPLDDKLIRDWCKWYLTNSGARDRLRTVFADMPLFGEAFVSPLWVEDKRVYHAYDTSGEVVVQEVPGYTGVRWHVANPADVKNPTGFDEWDQLPWFAIRLRYSLVELMGFVKDGTFKLEDVQKLKPKLREDDARKVQKDVEHVQDNPNEVYEMYELRGMFEIPSETENGQPDYEECVLTYSLDKRVLMRAIYNPYFGKARHFVRIPYLVQPHELHSQGVAEMSLPFQEEASTSHNQVIDAATSANAGITVVSTKMNIGPNEEIHPGKTVTTDGNPKEDMAIFHLSEPSQALGQVEEKAFFMNEKRTGVSVYNLGMESPQVGSRATATGTTALINEGNMRFWVSIDDMRAAIEELLYLTIQQEQQMRPEGYFFEKGRYIQFPQGDPRTSIGLSLKLSSESVNRDIEVQQMQLMMQVLNDYYMRLNQAMMLIMNPQFPPQAKLMAAQVMQASSVIVKKFVERFDVEDLDSVVPTIMSSLQQMGQMMGAIGGSPGQPPQAAAGVPPGGPQPPQLPPPGGPGPIGNPPPTRPM
jgi:hypothetical protein